MSLLRNLGFLYFLRFESNWLLIQELSPDFSGSKSFQQHVS